MKKVTYLMTMIFAVALMSTSCCKDDPIVPEPQTLEEQYPEWSSLLWVSTNGSIAEYPRLDITISDNIVTLKETRDLGNVGGIQLFPMQYEGIELTSSTITFTDPITNSGAIVRVYDILTPDAETVKIRYNGNTFVLD